MPVKVSTLLLKWYECNKRDLPWRNSKLPYNIWLSEIILQQTRVGQGLEYYRRFIEKYPSVVKLAGASEDEVLRQWQGLGYYTRARNLHSTARCIVNDHGGNFPDTFETLRELKGIGEYTAAALASMAFGQPVALVDGNVYRVLARLFDIHVAVNSTEGRKTFSKLATELLNHENPGDHNQAIMEFGALVCLPRNPDCKLCVLSDQCLALQRGTVAMLPIKKYRVKNRVRYFYYLYLICKDHTLLRKRGPGDIWHSLYEFPLIETEEHTEFADLIHLVPWNSFLAKNSSFRHVKTTSVTHKLSHQVLHCTFFLVETDIIPDEVSDFITVRISDLNKYAVPRVIDRYLDDLRKSTKA